VDVLGTSSNGLSFCPFIVTVGVSRIRVMVGVMSKLQVGLGCPYRTSGTGRMPYRNGREKRVPVARTVYTEPLHK